MAEHISRADLSDDDFVEAVRHCVVDLPAARGIYEGDVLSPFERPSSIASHPKRSNKPFNPLRSLDTLRC